MTAERPIPRLGTYSGSTSERRRIFMIIGIFATFALLVGGGAYYFVGVSIPKQKREKAQTEIAAWEKRHDEARACLLGAEPASSKTGEALAIRELAPDPWDKGTCTKLISKLSRGEAEDTGLPAVEEAWRSLDRAAGKFAAAFLAHVDPGGELPKNRNLDRLPGAFEELDGAHAELRKAASMPVLERATGTAKPLPSAEIIPLRDGNEPVKALDQVSMASSGSVIAFGKSKRELQMIFAPGTAPVIKTVGFGVQRTVPDAAWGAIGSFGELLVGPLDDAGMPVAKEPLKIAGQVQVFAVAGNEADGLVIAGLTNQLVLVRSKDGKLTADKRIDMGQIAFALDPAGRVLVAYNDAANKLYGFIAKGSAPAKVLEIGSGVPSRACLTATRAWVDPAEGDDIASFDEAGSKDHELPGHDLLGCTAKAALLHKRGAAHFTVCAEECRQAQLQGMRPARVATIAGDYVVGIAVRRNVIGVWRERGTPVYFGIPNELRPILATSDGKVIDVIADSDAGVVIVRLPVR